MTLQVFDQIEIPTHMHESWQKMIDLLAEICSVPAALIMRVHAREIEVCVSSKTPGNVYEQHEKADLNTGLYCETVMATRKELFVPNALTDPDWDHNPDIELGMISYCGLPITWPNGEIYGTICILDIKENHFSELYRKLLERFRDSIQAGLVIAHDSHVSKQTQAELLKTNESLEQQKTKRTARLEREIAEHQKANDSLRESEDRFRSFYQSTTMSAIISIDDKGRLTSWNPGAEKAFGYSENDILGQPLVTLIPERYRDAHQAGLKRALQTRVYRIIGKSVELHGLHKDGHEFPVELSLGVWSSEHRTYFSAIINDTTERKRAEAAREDSERKFRDFAEVSSDWFWETDSDLRYTYISDNYTAITGKPVKELLGKTRREMYTEKFEEDNEAWTRLFEVMERHQDFNGFTYTYLTNNGTPIILRNNGRAIFNSDGVFQGYRGIGIDITEQENARRRRDQALLSAERANQSKSEFLASMSHELRTPLNAILGFSDILRNQHFGPLGNSKYQEYAGDIHRSGEHLLELVNELLDVSAIESGKKSLEKELVSIGDIIEDCIHTVAVNADSKNTEMEITVADELSPLYADRRAIKQVLLNLLSNAIKFTPEGGEITVHAYASAMATRIIVTDNGPGISTDMLPDITNPFIKSISNPHIAEPGWGLGLAISKSLVELHDGVMFIESEVGKGTSVIIELPNLSPNAD